MPVIYQKVRNGHLVFWLEAVDGRRELIYLRIMILEDHDVVHTMIIQLLFYVATYVQPYPITFARIPDLGSVAIMGIADCKIEFEFNRREQRDENDFERLCIIFRRSCRKMGWEAKGVMPVYQTL